MTGATCPFDMAELETQAKAVLSPQGYSYVASGASSEDTMRANAESFRRWRIVPRMLRDVACRLGPFRRVVRSHSISLLRCCCRPVGVQSIVHPDGELATAPGLRAAQTGIPSSSCRRCRRVALEDVAAAMGDAPGWFQLYWPKDPELARSFLSRAKPRATWPSSSRWATAWWAGVPGTSVSSTCLSWADRWRTTSPTLCSAPGYVLLQKRTCRTALLHFAGALRRSLAHVGRPDVTA